MRATLEALLEQEGPARSHFSPRVSLYKTFHAVWAGAASNRDLPDSIDFVNSAPDKRLQALPPRYREAMLLAYVEGFSASETAEILGCTREEVEGQLIAAQRSIEDQLSTRVLIIEDESIIALDLERIVDGLGHDIAGIARTKDAAVKLAGAEKPGLVLADIRLADGSSGLDAANEILKSFDVPVIFITAYPERLLTGERPEPTYLITKPFMSDTVMATISQALFFHPPRQQLN